MSPYNNTINAYTQKKFYFGMRLTLEGFLFGIATKAWGKKPKSQICYCKK